MREETRWWWIRHAPVPCAGTRIYGQADLDADTSDEARFKALAKGLPEDAVVIRSNLCRTAQTLEALSAHGPAWPEALIEPDLAEQSFGKWEQRTWDDLVAEEDPDLATFWTNPYYHAPPEGESFQAMTKRVKGAIERIGKDHAGRDIIAVAHAGTIRAALVLAMGLDMIPEKSFAFHIDNTTLTRIDHSDGNWIIKAVGV